MTIVLAVFFFLGALLNTVLCGVYACGWLMGYPLPALSYPVLVGNAFALAGMSLTLCIRALTDHERENL